MEKRINVASAKFALDMVLLKFEKELQNYFDDWPEDPNGTLVKFDDLKTAFHKLTETGKELIGDVLGKDYEEIEPTPIEPTDPEDSTIYELIGYLYGVSDAAGHIGQNYFIAPVNFTGNIKSVYVGDLSYKYERLYNRCELYYGAPSNGTITVTTKDGKVYKNIIQGTGDKKSFMAKYFEPTNGNRGTWYCYRNMNTFPTKFYINVKSCPNSSHVILNRVITNNGVRYQDSDLVVKQSEVPGRGMAIVTNSGVCLGGEVEIYWYE